MSDYATVTALHNRYHDDYAIAKKQIYDAIGSMGDIEIFGKQVLVAVYVRPQKTANNFWTTTKAQAEDIYQGKAVMILKCGPNAFKGTKGYVDAAFGELGAPQVNDWVFQRPQDGVQISLIGDGGKRSKVHDFRGREIDAYDFDGWPCRIVDDDAFIGRMNKPHHIV